MKLTFCCAADNDLFTVLAKAGCACPRYATAAEAVTQAAPGSGLLILADGYPQTLTPVAPELLAQAAAKGLRVYLEYPSYIPGFAVDEPRHTEWERGVVSSDVFGPRLKHLCILGVHDCHFLPLSAPNPLLVVARVAGYDTAVYGLPEEAFSLLFAVPEQTLWVATTKLSQFVTARYAPTLAWQAIWEYLLGQLDPSSPVPSLSWEPRVRPAYGPHEPMPAHVEDEVLAIAAQWFTQSHVLVSPARRPFIEEMAHAEIDLVPTPGPEEPEGDGSLGLLEGYTSAITYDGNQPQRSPIRADCVAEGAMVLAMDGQVHGHARNAEVAKNLTDYLYFISGMCKGERADPQHAAYGLIAWGDIAKNWIVANYGDDDARVLLANMLTASALQSDRWDAPILRAILANLRTTGIYGFHDDRLDMPYLDTTSIEEIQAREVKNYALNFEAYLWACYLWAYRHTGYQPCLTAAKTAIRMTMDAYPDGWRWGDSMERARMLLPLAWLIRVEDTPEHRQWLHRIADDLLAVQQPCGALQERINTQGGGGHYTTPATNEAYGTAETPLIQQNGDPGSDQLYTTGFALFALHEAVAATGDPGLRTAEDQLADYLCRIQNRSESIPYLHGSWFRAFDHRYWECWASSGDIDWGAWCVEAGWGQAWIAAILALRRLHTSFWDHTAGSRIADCFDQVRAEFPGGIRIVPFVEA